MECMRGGKLGISIEHGFVRNQVVCIMDYVLGLSYLLSGLAYFE